MMMESPVSCPMLCKLTSLHHSMSIMNSTPELRALRAQGDAIPLRS